MKNREFLMTLLCFGLIFNTVNAQDRPEGKNEIRVGKEIGAYMEWGFGFRGLVNFGVSGKF
ncbi:MAG TPA: hypothetical protein PKN12_00215 [Bacteroidales bacterium]|nr:hypothetical protein [Bacteroidales bacterium]